MSKALEEELGFKVVFSNVEFLDATHSGARPATDQEKVMWQLLLDLDQRSSNYKKQLDAANHRLGQVAAARIAGVDAHSVRNSLGDPPEGGEQLTARELRAQKLAGG